VPKTTICKRGKEKPGGRRLLSWPCFLRRVGDRCQNPNQGLETDTKRRKERGKKVRGTCVKGTAPRLQKPQEKKKCVLNSIKIKEGLRPGPNLATC